jgi:hypothetical protein
MTDSPTEDYQKNLPLVSEGTDAALNLFGGGMSGAGKRVGTAGIFGGHLGKGWSHQNEALANNLEISGASPEFIHENTGLFKGHEGSWRQEISDKGLITKRLPETSGSVMAQAGNFIEHPELFKQYPQLQQMKMAVDPSLESERHAVFDPNINKITLGGPVLSQGLSSAQQQNAVHELQHAVQLHEGWQSGGDPGWVGDKVAEKLFDKAGKLPKNDPLYNETMRNLLYIGKHKPDISYEMYHRLPGETEARNAGDRFMFDKFNRFTSQPMTSTPSEVLAMLNKHGFDYDKERGLVNSKTWQGASPEVLPPGVRALYDRLPAQRGMVGNRTYPWKTEDVPRNLQFNYAR